MDSVLIVIVRPTVVHSTILFHAVVYKGHGNFKCTFCSLCLHCLLSFEILEIKLISNISHNDKNNIDEDEK